MYGYGGHGVPTIALVGLQDIKQLSQEAVRDILRASTKDSELQIVTKG